MLRQTPQMLKYIKNSRKQNFKDEEKTLQLEKEDTRRSNVKLVRLKSTILYYGTMPEKRSLSV